jgi:hypothetical protein
MNVEIGTETPIFLFWEYLFQNFGMLSLQCGWGVLGVQGGSDSNSAHPHSSPSSVTLRQCPPLHVAASA